jgi:hypothetical protein
VFAAPAATAQRGRHIDPEPAQALGEPGEPPGTRLPKTAASGAHAPTHARGRAIHERSARQVIPDERTTWRVYAADASVLLSEHTNATEAELVAKRLAEARGAERVVIHDRYHRTRDVAASLAGPRADARRPRTPARRRP